MRIYKLLLCCYFIIISIMFYTNILFASDCKHYKNYKQVLGKTHYAKNFKHFSYAKAHSKKGGLLKLVNYSTFNTFSPFGLGLLPKDYYLLSYDSLFIVPLDDINTYYPLLAKGYCTSGNKLYLQLNSKAMWSDNIPLSATDVVFTLKALKAIGYPQYVSALKDIKKIKIISEHHLIIYGSNAFSTLQLQTLFAIPIIPKHYWEHKSLLENQLRVPPSSGAYTITAFKSNGKSITFKRNKSYWGANLPTRVGHYNFAQIKYIYASSQQVAYNLFNQDKINFLAFNSVDINLINKFKKISKKNIVIKKVPIGYIPIFKGLFFNTKHTNLQNVNVRKALSLAYDFNSINTYIFNNQQKRLLGLFTNSSFGGSVPRAKFNLQKADKLLNEAGFRVKNNVRISKKGKPLELLIVFNSKKEFYNNLTFFNNLRRLHIKVLPKFVANSQYPNLLKYGLYDIIFAEYLFSNKPKQELIQYFGTQHNKNIYNYSQLNNFKVDALLNNIINKRFNPNILRQLDKYLAEQYIFIPLYYYPDNIYIYKGIFSPYILTKFGIDIFTWGIK